MESSLGINMVLTKHSIAGKHIGLQIYWKEDSIGDFFVWV